MSNTPIANVDTPDPWILQHNSTYYLTFTLGSRIEIWSSPTLESFHTATKSTIYTPSPSDIFTSDLWAPELHNLHGTWYIYFCGAPPNLGNKGHRTLLLRSHDPDPMDANAWVFLGPLKGLPDDQWSIDATVFTVPGPAGLGLYCCYSGWPLGDQSDTQQDLFLVQMADPETAVPSSLTCISRATLPWERPDGGKRGVNEGPTFLSLPPCRDFPAGFQGIVFSAHGSWTCEYKLGILALVDPSNPCNERSWVKRHTPLLVSDEKAGGPFGPGHASFVHGDGKVYCVYHGTERKDEGWNNRKARVVALDYGCFAPQAMPVCCANAGGRNGGGQMGMAMSGYPGAHTNQPVSSGSGTGNGGTNAKIWGEVERRVPGQYKGYLDKVKKFF